MKKNNNNNNKFYTFMLRKSVITSKVCNQITFNMQQQYERTKLIKFSETFYEKTKKSFRTDVRQLHLFNKYS